MAAKLKNSTTPHQEPQARIPDQELEKITSKKNATIAILDWSHIIEDYLDQIHVSLEQLQKEFIGSWIFAYIQAFENAGIRTVWFPISAKVSEVTVLRHRPTGGTICILPAPKSYMRVRESIPNPYATTIEAAAGGVKGLRRPLTQMLKHLAPYIATPLALLMAQLRRWECEALVVQEYEHARFDVAVLAAKTCGIPVFATFQGGDWQLSRLESLIRPFTIRRADALIVGTKTEAERVHQRYNLPASRVARIFNPVDVETWNPINKVRSRRKHGIPETAKVVAWHGRVEMHRKGLDIMLESWNELCKRHRHSDLRLILIGTGPDVAKIDDRISVLALRGIHWKREFVGDRTELISWLSAADIYAFPSRHEGFPCAPMEAMCCSLPVVARDVEGISDIFERRELDGGIIISSRSGARELADAIEGLLFDEQRCRALGSAARKRADTAFSMEVVGSQLHELFLKAKRN